MGNEQVKQEIRQIAERLAAEYEAGELDESTRARLDSDQGLEVDGYACWLNRDRNSVLVWAGNEHDEDMNWPAEVPVSIVDERNAR